MRAHPLSVVPDPPVTASDDSWVEVIGPGPVPRQVPDSPASPARRTGVDLAPFGVIEVVDGPAFPVVSANPAAIRLLGHALTRGTPLAHASDNLASMVTFHRSSDGSTFEIELASRTVSATLRRAGRTLCLYLVPADDTVVRLRRAIATAAHEIRTPVTVIFGAAETMQTNLDRMDADRRERLLASVARQARVLDTITADLLTAAQIQRGTLRVQLETVDVAASIEQVVDGRFDVSVDIEDERPVLADPIRLEQMLANLLTNGQKYGAAPYCIRVRAEGEQVAIDVSDSGPGVPEEFRSHLFREFSRASGTVAKGTGLGLYVVRTLAEAQGGTVRYAPRPEGGSVFTIMLPAR